MIKILVVDDSHTQRVMILEALTKYLTKFYTFEVTEAVNGEQAQKVMEKLNKEDPSNLFNLVITDLIMPKMNGYQLCRWIKGNSLQKSIPVIMCTTKDEEFDLYWGKKQGADAYLTKPFESKVLAQLVREILKNNTKSNS